MSQLREICITLPCRLGLHMRAAVRFLHFARKFRSDIKIRKGKIIADGKNIFGILLLGATWKSKLQFQAEGEDAQEAIRAIESYFSIQENCYDSVLR